MNKHKKSRQASTPTHVYEARVHETKQSVVAANRWQSLISLWLVIHFFGLLLALWANLVPSAMQRRMLETLAPYLTVINQSYGMVPLEMVQGVELDHPFLFEVHLQGESTDSWHAVLPPGTADAKSASHSWKQFMHMSAMVALEQQHPIVTGLCEAAVRSYSRSNSSSIDGVRIIRQVAPSYEQAELIASGQGDLIRSELSDEVLYQAAIVRFPDGRIAFVSDSTPTRAAKSLTPETPAKRSDPGSQP